MVIEPPFSRFLVVGLALFGFGFVYNWLVGWLEKKGYEEGYLAWLVAGGVAVTLIGVAVVDVRAAALALGAFVCSGFWMVWGSWWRHVKRRAAGQAALHRDYEAAQGAQKGSGAR
jgi:hypothetical protein